MPGSTKQGAAVQLTLIVQGNNGGMHMRRSLIQMYNSLDNPVAVTFTQPLRGYFRPFPSAGKVVTARLALVVGAEMFEAGTQKHFHDQHGILGDVLIPMAALMATTESCSGSPAKVELSGVRSVSALGISRSR